jgi:putative flippase GtrA
MGRGAAATERRGAGTDRANGAKGARLTRTTRARSAGFVRFGIVGASGIVVNELAIAALVSGLGLHYLVGYLLATQCSTLWNFAFVETWAFRTASPTNRRWHRFVMLMVVNNVANVLTAPLYVAFTSLLGINYLVSNILTLGIVFIGRFAIAERIWGGGAAGGAGTDVGPSHADAVTPTERGAAHDDEVIELLARVTKLETAPGQHRARNAKWFPAG